MKSAALTNVLIMACILLLAGNLLRARPSAAVVPEVAKVAIKHNVVYSGTMVGLRDQLDKWSAQGWRTTGFTYSGSQYVAVMEK